MPVHVLYHCRHVCDAPELLGCSTPAEWPEGHSWVDPTQKHLADCERCRAFFEDHEVVEAKGKVYIAHKLKSRGDLAAALLGGRPRK